MGRDDSRYLSRNPVSDCPFCAIGRGEDAEVEVICQGPAWMAFFPPEPATPGHTLIIPRAHVEDLAALDRELGAELMAAVGRVSRALSRALDPEGMNLINSLGRVAEQTVSHLHFHLVPRWPEDGFGSIWPPKESFSRDQAEDLAGLVRQACAEEGDE